MKRTVLGKLGVGKSAISQTVISKMTLGKMVVGKLTFSPKEHQKVGMWNNNGSLF